MEKVTKKAQEVRTLYIASDEGIREYVLEYFFDWRSANRATKPEADSDIIHDKIIHDALGSLGVLLPDE